MRPTTDLFTVNGKPMLVPDEKVTVNYEDLDSSDSGRDESGVMHRFVTRYKVPSWTFSYAHMTEEEKQYMESLFPAAPTFSFQRPSLANAGVLETTKCYRSKFGMSLKNASTGLWSGYSFTVTEC